MIQLSVIEEQTLFECLDQLFQPISRITPRNATVGRILYGHWGLEDVVLVKCSVATASKLAIWEIHCHGGTMAVNSILQSLAPFTAASATTATGQYERLPDLLNESLIHTSTRQTATWILRQMDGRLETTLCSILSAIESGDSHQHRNVINEIDQILKWQSFSNRLLNPARILIAGPPNAGKSSLINRLVGFDRSIVFDQPGTTRDLVEATTVFDGWTFQFIDSAGLRSSTDDPIEREGMRAVRTIAASCDGCLLVQDATELTTLNPETRPTIDHSGMEIESLLQCLPQNAIVIRAANKLDLVHESQRHALGEHSRERSLFLISAITGAGIDALVTAVVSALIPEIPGDSAVIPAHPKISNLLHGLRTSLINHPQIPRDQLETLRHFVS